MVITTLLAYLVARGVVGREPRAVAGSLAAFFLVIELGFFGANLIKIPHGGWFPLVIGAVVYTAALDLEARARAARRRGCASACIRSIGFLQDITAQPPQRVAGTAIFMTSNLLGTPPTLLHNLEHNKVLHERVILLTVVTSDVPHVPPEERSDSRAARPGVLPPDAALRLHGGTRRAGRAASTPRSRASRSTWPRRRSSSASRRCSRRNGRACRSGANGCSC